MPDKLTEAEHIARAMLLGMHYHDGNGMDPFYYKKLPTGQIDGNSYIDAVTLEPLVNYREDTGIDWTVLNRKSKASRWFKSKGEDVL